MKKYFAGALFGAIIAFSTIGSRNADAGTRLVYVDSFPEGAAITLDGIPSGKSTPDYVSMSAAHHIITMNPGDGWNSVVQPVDIANTNGQQVFITLTPVAAGGAQGEPGPQGPVGPPGITGSNGIQGPQGIPGTSDFIGSYFVRTDPHGTPQENGQGLINDYQTALAMISPGGLNRSSSNRVVLFVAPGQYDLQTGALNLTGSFVDVIGMSTNNADQHIYGISGGFNTGVLMQSADDVHIENLSVECTQSVGVAVYDSTAPAAYFPENNLSATVVRNCNFQGAGSSWSMRLATMYSGTYDHCTGGEGSFGSFGGSANGIFINCVGGDFSFGSDFSTASGTFTNCVGGLSSFGSIASHATGKFTGCIALDGSFGGQQLSSDASGGRFFFCQLTSLLPFPLGGYNAFDPSTKFVGCVLNDAAYPPVTSPVIPF